MQNDNKESHRLIWIGAYMSKSEFEEDVDKGYYDQFAAYNAQRYYIKGLFEANDSNIEVISVPKYREYPRSDIKYCAMRKSTDENGCTITFIPFSNYLYISHISKKRELKKYLKLQIDNNNYNNNCSFIFYAMHSPRMFAAKIIKKYLPNARTAIIVPDLPQFTDGQMSFLKKILKKIDWISIKSYMKYFDKYIFYSKYMPEYIGTQKYDSTVIEGIASYNPSIDTLSARERDKTIVYSGSLIKRNNIKSIIEGFIKSEIDYTLCFYGAGEEELTIKKYEKTKPNVRYMENVDPDELKKVLRKASLLLNIRNTDEEYTKFSCPSKLFEYMISGTPVLTTRLAGIPDEYFDYMYVIDDYSIDGLADWFKKFCLSDQESRDSLGKKAQEFIVNNKTYRKQAEKLLDFIK